MIQNLAELLPVLLRFQIEFDPRALFWRAAHTFAVFECVGKYDGAIEKEWVRNGQTKLSPTQPKEG